jgi:hypothetical protein
MTSFLFVSPSFVSVERHWHELFQCCLFLRVEPTETPDSQAALFFTRFTLNKLRYSQKTLRYLQKFTEIFSKFTEISAKANSF